MKKLFFLHQGHHFSGGNRYVKKKHRKLGVAGRVPQKEES